MLNGRLQEFTRNGQLVMDAVFSDSLLCAGSHYREFYEDGLPLFDGTVDSEHWLNGTFYPYKGVRCTQDIVAGRRAGKRRCEYPSGQLFFEARWEDDRVADQVVRHYYPNGKLFCEVNYRKGGRNGRAKYYWPNGKLAARGDFVTFHGKVEKGSRVVGRFKTDVPAEPWTTWYENGVRCSEIQRIHIKPVKARWYHPNGRLGAEFGVNLIAEKDGEARYWDENGTLVRTESYAKGKLITTRDFGGPVPQVSYPESFYETEIEARFAGQNWDGHAPFMWLEGQDRP